MSNPHLSAAHERVRRAKERMDAAIEVLNAAESEWHDACVELDLIECGETVDFDICEHKDE